MERKIGEIFEYNGEWHQCVECDSCGKCSLHTTECGSGTKSDLAVEVFGECSKIRRSDSKHAIFKKLEKVGEQFLYKGKQMQSYRRATDALICNWNNSLLLLEHGDSDIIDIEIKPTKEDMEEKKLNLKPFDIQKAREGKPVCTRDGGKARIICFNSTLKNYPLVVLIEGNEGEYPYVYTAEGKINEDERESVFDLMMFPEKRSGWAKVRKDVNLYATKEEADRKMIGNTDYVSAKVEWEE